MQKNVLVSLAFELVALYSHYYKENTCNWQSMCQQTVLRFHNHGKI